MTDRYLCELCDHFVSGADLVPVTNYGARQIRRNRDLAGQCPVCSGLCYVATDDDMIKHMNRELKAKGLSICP